MEAKFKNREGVFKYEIFDPENKPHYVLRFCGGQHLLNRARVLKGDYIVYIEGKHYVFSPEYFKLLFDIEV